MKFLCQCDVKEALCLVLKCFVQGLDLSPYFLSVAQHKEKRGTTRKNPIKWIHANGEDTGLPSKSFDLVSIAYVVCHFLTLLSIYTQDRL